MAEDNRLFKTEKDVYEYFIQLNEVRTNFPNNPRTERLLKLGIMIDTKLRRDILTGKNEGKITLNGVVEDYMFKSMAGGVYKCYVSDRRAFIAFGKKLCLTRRLVFLQSHMIQGFHI